MGAMKLFFSVDSFQSLLMRFISLLPPFVGEVLILFNLERLQMLYLHLKMIPSHTLKTVLLERVLKAKWLQTRDVLKISTS